MDEKKPPTGLPDSFNRFSMEKMMRGVTKILEEQEFETDEEAERFMQQLGGRFAPNPGPSDDPLEQAQNLVYEAHEAASAEEAVVLAHRALEVSEDCADAYVLLAETEAETLEAARDYYAKGVEAGERALGPEMFENNAGHFWGIIETRPYMRARLGLAEASWLLGDDEPVLEHYREMLRLNPNDNQGVRWKFSDCLMELDRQDELEALLEEYDDDTARWAYHRALLCFRQEGESEEANARVAEAIERNPHVPDFVLGKKKLPQWMPAYAGFGDENEAVDYAVESIMHWRDTYGALRWLRHTAKRARRARRR